MSNMMPEDNDCFEAALYMIAIEEAMPAIIHEWECTYRDRADPGIRAFWAKVTAGRDRLKIRVLSYEETIGVAWLLGGGLGRQLAAALVVEGLIRVGNSYQAVGGRERDYRIIGEALLSDGSRWVISQSLEAPADLTAIGHYSVVCFKNGRLINLEECPFPVDQMSRQGSMPSWIDDLSKIASDAGVPLFSNRAHG